MMKAGLGAFPAIAWRQFTRANRRGDLQILQTSTTSNHEALYDSLDALVPGLTEKLRQHPPSSNNESESNQDYSLPNRTGRLNPPPVRLSNSDAQPHPLSTSAAGDDFTGLGCFHLGMSSLKPSFSEEYENTV